MDGAVAGLIQVSGEPEPNHRDARIDMFLDPALHGRGVGTEALRRVVRHLIADCGHHCVTIDPAASTAASRAHTRRAASGPWA
jgi:aminoglycoside 6'-N-acetyltransferase